MSLSSFSPQSPEYRPPEAGQESGRLHDLSSLRTRQVRLVVSVPALLLVYTLLLTVLIHINLQAIIDAIPPAQTAVREQAEMLSELVLYLGIAGAIASAGVGILLAWQIVRPLRGMIEGMEELAGGELPPKVAPAQFAEIGALGSSFNSMLEQLQGLFDERDRQMRESASGAIMTLDAEGVVIAADSAASRLLGIPGDALLRHRMCESLRLQEADNAEFAEALEEALESARKGRTASATVQYQRPGGGESFPLSLVLSPLESASPEDESFLLDVRDLSGMEEFHEQIQRADRLAALGTLAAGIAHEIRNPLASIRGMTQLLAEDMRASEAPDDSMQYAQRTLSEIERLERLVTSIMDFANTADAPVKPVDLNQMLKDAWETCKHRAAPDALDRIEVQWDLDPQLPFCPLEESRMQQALVNVTSNALDALAGSSEGKLRFASWVSEEAFTRPLMISIANTGEPIPPALRARLFEPFFTTRAGGTGLGLPITNQIVISNGGLVELHCENGMIEFRLRFPLTGRRGAAPKRRSSTALRRPDFSTGANATS